MRVVVVDPPQPVFEAPELRKRLGVDDEERDDELLACAKAAQASIDGPHAWLGRAIGVQTLEVRLDHFDCGSIRLPCPEIIGILSVKYIDPAGVEQTIAADRYELLGPSLVPAWNMAWPRPRWQREAVRIRYRAGYETLPDDLRMALLLMAGDLWAARETFTVGSAVEIPMSIRVDNLLASYRVF